MSKKHYVVWKGEKTGVFDSWPMVQSLTAGRSDAQYMGFPSKEEAEQAFASTYTKALMQRSLKKGAPAASSGSKTKTSSSKSANTSAAQISAPTSEADISIYCDGACSPNPGKSGTGIAIYDQGKVIQLWHGLYEANGTNNTAELNGMLEAFKLAQGFIAQGKTVAILSDSKYSIDSITKWATGWKNKGWKKANGETIKNPELVKASYELYQKIKRHVQIKHVKGHANIEGNELSDRMAVYARMHQQKSFTPFEEKMTIKDILAMPSG